MMVRLRISQSVLSWHSWNRLLQMRVTLSLSVVPWSAPNDAVRCPVLPPPRHTNF